MAAEAKVPVEVEMLAAIQWQQQDRLMTLPNDPVERTRLAQRLAQHAVGEIYGYLEASGFKSFFPAPVSGSRSNRLIELVDAAKLVLAAAWAEGFSEEEFVAAFVEKTRVVSQRWQERQLTGRVCTIDMDGVLCNFNHDWGPTEGAFVERGGVLEIQPIPGAAETMKWLKARGWTVVILTARKRHRHQRIDGDTRRWLELHDIPFDAILWSSDKGQTIADLGVPVYFHVDDTIKHALDVRNVVRRSFLFAERCPEAVDGLTAVRDHADLILQLEAFDDVEFAH